MSAPAFLTAPTTAPCIIPAAIPDAPTAPAIPAPKTAPIPPNAAAFPIHSTPLPNLCLKSPNFDCFGVIFPNSSEERLEIIPFISFLTV